MNAYKKRRTGKLSNASKGAYYRSRTKRWLIAAGWQVADLERVHWIWTPAGRIAVKRDQLGADLLALSADAAALVQVKGGAQAIGRGQFRAAQRAFAAVARPEAVQAWVVAWAPRARVPRVIVCARGCRP